MKDEKQSDSGLPETPGFDWAARHRHRPRQRHSFSGNAPSRRGEHRFGPPLTAPPAWSRVILNLVFIRILGAPVSVLIVYAAAILYLAFMSRRLLHHARGAYG